MPLSEEATSKDEHAPQCVCNCSPAIATSGGISGTTGEPYDGGTRNDSPNVKGKGKEKGRGRGGGGPKKKGANPLKAKLKAGPGADLSAATDAAASDPGAAWLRIPTASSPAPSCSCSCHPSKASTSSPAVQAAERPFEPVLEPPLLTLLFTAPIGPSVITAEQIQHATLSRPEAYYESPPDKYGNTYLSWDKIGREGIKLCRGYGAFNFPLSSLQEWVHSMWHNDEAAVAHRTAAPASGDKARLDDPEMPASRTEGLDADELSRAAASLTLEAAPVSATGSTEPNGVDASSAVAEPAGGPRWYERCCNRGEASLLRYLEDVGALDLTPQNLSAVVRTKQQTPCEENAQSQDDLKYTEQEAQAPVKQEEGIPKALPRSALTKTPVRYIISALAPSAQPPSAESALPHERLHALFFLSPSYRRIVYFVWGEPPEGGKGRSDPQSDGEVHRAPPARLALSAKTRKVIGADLKLRGYAKHVWADEFQAYLLGEGGREGSRGPRGEGLWGPRALEELRPVREFLEKEVLPSEIKEHLNGIDIWQ